MGEYPVFDWNTYVSIITNTTTSITYYVVEAMNEARNYKFYTILENGNIIHTARLCQTIEEALLFEESFVKKPKVYQAQRIIKENVTLKITTD